MKRLNTRKRKRKNPASSLDDLSHPPSTFSSLDDNYVYEMMIDDPDDAMSLCIL
jgi:hypothetical protein